MSTRTSTDSTPFAVTPAFGPLPAIYLPDRCASSSDNAGHRMAAWISRHLRHPSHRTRSHHARVGNAPILSIRDRRRQ
jgi:hypothetical protein